MNHPDTTISNGIIGTATSLGATIVSLMPQVEASLIIGIFVGLASFSKICYDIYKDHKKRNK